VSVTRFIIIKILDKKFFVERGQSIFLEINMERTEKNLIKMFVKKLSMMILKERGT